MLISKFVRCVSGRSRPGQVDQMDTQEDAGSTGVDSVGGFGEYGAVSGRIVEQRAQSTGSVYVRCIFECECENRVSMFKNKKQNW